MGYIDIKKLTLDELVGVVNLYPWFGGARMELCQRMNKIGGGLAESQYADAAMYVPSRSKRTVVSFIYLSESGFSIILPYIRSFFKQMAIYLQKIFTTTNKGARID